MPNSKPIINTKINWRKYNRALGERANISSILPENIEEIWYNHWLTGKRGTPKIYSDKAIIICLTVAEIYHLPLRQTECFLTDLFLQMGLSLTCPNYSILSRRRTFLKIDKIVYQYAPDDALLVDSSGMKISGDGEWHQEHHEIYRRKTWLKVHLGVSWKTRQIMAYSCTSSNVIDAQMLAMLLEQAPKTITECIGDGAYDMQSCYEESQKLMIKPIFRIRSGAVEHPDEPALQVRNVAIQFINSNQNGEQSWKSITQYHRRSLVENAFFRTKTIFGSRVSAKLFPSQIVQIAIRINLLNRFMFKNK